VFDNFGISGGSMLGAIVAPTPFACDLFTYLSAMTGYDYQPGKIDRSDDADYPQIAYTLVSEERNQDLSGPTGLVTAVYQFDVWSPIDTDCYVVADQIRRAFSGFPKQRSFMGATRVQYCVVKNGSGGYVDIGVNNDDGMHRETREVTIWYIEPLPG
jgi:hypothetical protein